MYQQTFWTRQDAQRRRSVIVQRAAKRASDETKAQKQYDRSKTR